MQIWHIILLALLRQNRSNKDKARHKAVWNRCFNMESNMAGQMASYDIILDKNGINCRTHDNTSATADHVKTTGHNIKWDHFDILVKGKTDYDCKIKETLFIQKLEPQSHCNHCLKPLAHTHPLAPFNVGKHNLPDLHWRGWATRIRVLVPTILTMIVAFNINFGSEKLMLCSFTLAFQLIQFQIHQIFHQIFRQHFILSSV